jgi:hypothetical protein
MKFWTCVACGATEHLTIIPEGCSVCGGQMETQDDRRISGFCEGVARYHEVQAIEPWAADAIKAFEDEIDAANADVAAVIRLWQAGEDLDERQRAIVTDALTSNRVDLFARVYERAA